MASDIIQQYNELLQENKRLKAGADGSAKDRQDVMAVLKPVLRSVLEQNGPAPRGAVEAWFDMLVSPNPKDALAAAEQVEAKFLLGRLSQLPLIDEGKLTEGAFEVGELHEMLSQQTVAMKILASHCVVLFFKVHPDLLKSPLLGMKIEDIAHFAAQAIPPELISEFHGSYVKAALAANKAVSLYGVASSLDPRQRAIVKAIAEGAHTFKNIADDLKVQRRDLSDWKDFDVLEKLEVLQRLDFDNGLQSVRLHLLTYAGKEVYKELEHQEPLQSVVERHLHDDSNKRYLQRQGFWVDELKWLGMRRRVKVYVEKTTKVPGTDRTVIPDLTVMWGNKEQNRIDIQVEMGDKTWSSQRQQVVTGTFKALCASGMCDVFVQSTDLIESIQKEMKAANAAEVTGGGKLRAPGRVRFYSVEGYLKDIPDWPFGDQGAKSILTLV